MATAAFKGGFTFKVSDNASPEVYTTLEEVRSISGFGKTNETIDATSFDSGNTRENIAGLADGQEFTVDCIRVHTSPSIQDAVIAYVDAGSNTTIEITWTDGTNSKTFTFAVTAVGYEYAPSYEDVSTITFTMKISGDVTVA